MGVNKTFSRIPEQTWSKLNAKFLENSIPFEEILSRELHTFLETKANAIGTNIGYVFSCIVAAISFILGRNAKIEISQNQFMNLNMFMVFVGQPSTGKSTAIKKIITEPFNEFVTLKNLMTSTITTSGLTKHLASGEGMFLINPEVSEYLLKVMKNSDENCSGDIELLSKIYSGEACTMKFGTENAREISPDVPFCLLGATQMQSMGNMIASMDKGNGFLDRFFITVPKSFRPMPETQKNSLEKMNDYGFDISDIYTVAMLVNQNTHFYFSPEAERYFSTVQTQFIEQLNIDLRDGNPTSKSKITEMVPKISVVLHVLEFSICQLSSGTGNIGLPEEINTPTIRNATRYVELIEEQKEVYRNFLKELLPITPLSEQVDPSVLSPEFCKKSIMLSPGKFVTFSSLKQSSSKKFRILLTKEFDDIIRDLVSESGGRFVEFVARGSRKTSKIFIKNESYDTISNDLKSLFSKIEYDAKLALPSPKSFTPNIIESLNTFLPTN